MVRLVLRGSPFEQGLAIGKAFGERIRARLSQGCCPSGEQYASEAERAAESREQDEPAEYLARCAEVLLYLQEHAPDLVELMRGVARGAGCSFEEVFRLNSRRAIAATRIRTDELFGCSAVIAPTEDAGVVLARTGDEMLQPGQAPPALRGVWDEGLAVFDVRPARGLRHILFGSVEELVAGDGMNEAGVCFACLNLPYGPQGVGGGIPYNLVGRALAPRAESVGHALEILSQWRQASRSKCWPLADGEGRCMAVEKSFDRTGVVEPGPDGVLAHANDYMSPALADLAANERNSADRVRTLRDYVARVRASGTLTSRAMQDALRVHSAAGSICRHGQPGPADALGFTSSAVVYLPQLRRMHVLCGAHPCRGQFHELSL